MCRWIPRAPGRGVMWLALVGLAPVLTPVAASAGVVPPIDRPSMAWVESQRPAAVTEPAAGVSQTAGWWRLDLDDTGRETRDVEPGDGARVTFEMSPSATQAEAPVVVVPLPPALGTGLLGLAGMAVLRVGRRVYRRP